MRKVLLLALLVFYCSTLFAQEQAVTGIMFAFPEEGEWLKQRMEAQDSIIIAQRIFYSGKLEGKPIILVESGVGLIAAAMTTQLLIDNFHPSQILFTGICGSLDPEYKIGDLAIPYKWVIHDYGYYDSSGFRLALREDKRFIYYLADSDLLSIAGEVAKQDIEFKKIEGRVPKIRFSASGASGNAFIDQKEKRQGLKYATGADIVDMESGAVAQVANANAVPVLIIRSCSDLAGGSGSSTAEDELEQFFKVAAENSARFLLEILKKIK
jgi:adenosylhomocysteine nucleosidase